MSSVKISPLIFTEGLPFLYNGPMVTAVPQPSPVVRDLLFQARHIPQTILEFKELVLVGIELLRAQVPQVTFPGGALEGLSTSAGRLLKEGGVVASEDAGILLFHQEISKDKPSLRKMLRESDERAGRVERVKRKSSKAQKATRLAVKAGEVRRNKLGQITGLTPAAQRVIKRVKSRQAAARRKATIKRQRRFAAALRRL